MILGVYEGTDELKINPLDMVGSWGRLIKTRGSYQGHFQNSLQQSRWVFPPLLMSVVYYSFCHLESILYRDRKSRGNSFPCLLLCTAGKKEGMYISICVLVPVDFYGLHSVMVFFFCFGFDFFFFYSLECTIIITQTLNCSKAYREILSSVLCLSFSI